MNRRERRRPAKEAKGAGKAADHGFRGEQLAGEGKIDEAIEAFRRAISIDPQYAAAHHNLGVLLRRQGLINEAIESYTRAIAIQPDFAEVHNNLGASLKDLGRLDEAVASYLKALAIKPDYAEAHNNLGNALRELGKLDEAVANFHKALAIKPDIAEAHNNLGNVLQELGKLDEAVASFHKALDIKPDYVEAHSNLGSAFKQLGKLDEAVASFHKALAIEPDYAEAHSNLGNAFAELGRLDEAVASYLKALAIKPDYAEAHNNLGNVLQKLGKLDEAVASFHKALDIKPDYAEAHSNLGPALQDLGRLDEAVASYHKALAIKPDFAKAYSNLLVTMPFMSNFDAADVFAEAKRAGAAFEAPFTDLLTRRHGNNPDPDRTLKIGYLSPCLAKHSLTPQIEPVLKMHRRDRVSVHVYAHVPRPDEVTVRLQELADHWTFVHGLTDHQVAERIIEDGIDILVDPMGHWGDNRLLVFARKPAPVQVSYLCQGLTTGLSAMDYAIGDRWLNEGGAMQSFATEQVVELAGGFVATSMDRETPIGQVPSETNGFITFCSFNNPAKISDASLRLWASVLNELPTARLLIKGRRLEHPEKRSLMMRRLEEHGIPAERAELRGFVLEGDHMDVHNLVDIALDTVPFNGGATTVDALWMGVPVITLIGDTISGRYSYSHLNRVGVPELTAHSEEEFVEIAVNLAGDVARLKHYRKTLRPMMKASSLLDALPHVAELEEAYSAMWRRWCAGMEPEAFTISSIKKD